MIHNFTGTQISQKARATINAEILSNFDNFSKEEIYNSYTGIGGLHGLKQSDYANYNEYAKAKREIEQGQFFTPHEICRQMVEMLTVQPTDMVLDICCGMGNFINFLPNQHNAYGYDIDDNAIKVAKHLYPNANLEVANLMTHYSDERFDIVIGNPPFNLDFDGVLSQFYYMTKAYWALNPAGILLVIVPQSFLSNEFWEKSRVTAINRDFSFIGQTKLAEDAFAAVGVEKYATKIMAFQRESDNIEMTPYSSEDFVDMVELTERIATARGVVAEKKLELHQETLTEVSSEKIEFEYKLKKYLYELKTHKALEKHYDKAIALVSKFRNQKPPIGCTPDEYKDWEKRALTYKKVLVILKRYIKNQNLISRKEVALVKMSKGFKLKGYSPNILYGIDHKYTPMYRLLNESRGLPQLPTDSKYFTAKLRKQYVVAQKFIERKKREYRLQQAPFTDMDHIPAVTKLIKRLWFYNKEMEKCKFTPLQQKDMGLIFQKQFALLNWQQGSGKTAVAYHYGKYHSSHTKNTVVLAPAIAIHLTWEPFMQRHKEKYIIASKPEHLRNVPKGAFVLLSLSMIGELVKPLKKFMKERSNKICLLFDESDEITNPRSKRTGHTLNVFRRAKYKLLATGTTTRNCINELYSQFELLYNNSANLICYPDQIYYQTKEGDIDNKNNERWGLPFPARGGANLFKSCFSPCKASVFGIEKQNQDVYNKSDLADIIGRTIITRKFKEFAGDKYEVINLNVEPHEGERAVYKKILEEFQQIMHIYFNPIKDSKKESQLNLVRKIQLLIRACSTPHTMEGYYGDEYPNKTKQIERMLKYEIKGKVAIGCTSREAVELYKEFLTKTFPERPLFIINGDVQFKSRQKVLDKFEKTTNGILVCTQQSLKSSANVPTCEDVILESLQWNIPRMEQFYFRFIRLDSVGKRRVYFLTYENSIEQNLMSLLLTKERLNEFIKAGEVKEESDIFEEYDIDPSIIGSLFTKEKGEDGKFHINCGWGQQKVS
ncbi:MAG: N-6 DNA methylase [Rikenellaceae bacterium]